MTAVGVDLVRGGNDKLVIACLHDNWVRAADRVSGRGHSRWTDRRRPDRVGRRAGRPDRRRRGRHWGVRLRQS